MMWTTSLCVLWVAVLTPASPSPQYFPLPLPGQADYAPSAPDQTPSGSQALPQTLRNFTAALDPLTDLAVEELLKNDVPRQAFYGAPSPMQPGYHQGPPYPQNQFSQYPGAPQFSPQYSPNPQLFPRTRTPPPSSQPQPQGAYPQIYKLDNLVIIANPVPQTACTQTPLTTDTFPSLPIDATQNRFGNMGTDGIADPSKCTWAIVACCSSSNNDVRYNCFELLGCPGFFFDVKPCEREVVESATRAVVAYYRNNSTSTPVNNNL